MLKLYITLFCIVCLFRPVSGQASFSIAVRDSISGIPVADAAVDIKGKFSGSTDENGYVMIKTAAVSADVLSVTRIGYQSRSVLIAELQLNPKLIIYLTRKVSGLSEIVVRSASNSGIFKTISDLDIHLRPINNSQEVLRMIPGLFIGQHAGGGKSEQIFLRGFDIDHGTDINISVDGMPVNMVSHAHGQGYADLHFLIPEIIDKVKFNKGPYFADKGNFTTAGYVEFKTKNYLENNFIKAEGGQFNTFRGITALNLLNDKARQKSQSLYFAGEASFTRGYFESPQNFNRFNGMLKYHGKISEGSTLTAMVSGFGSRWNASGQIPMRAVADGSIGFYGAIDNTEGGKTSRYNVMVELLSNLNDGAVFRNNVYYTKNHYQLYSNFTFFKTDPLNGDQIRQKEERDLLGYNGSFQKVYLVGRYKTETTAGVQIRYDMINDIELSRTKNRTTLTEKLMFGDVNEFNTGAYVSQKISLNEDFDITAGARADLFTNAYHDEIINHLLRSNTTVISPKVNLNYRVSEKVQLYWYNGRGFHSNDTRVAVLQSGKRVAPPALGTDIGGVFKIGKKLILQTAVWYLHLDQEFIYVGDEGVVEPSGKSRRVGIDISTRYELLKNLYADFDVSVSNPRALGVARKESYLPLAPIFTSVGGLTYRKHYGWNGSLRYRLMANRPANEDYTITAKGYCIVDGALNFSTKRWEAGIAIQNLLNTKWKETQFDTESRLQTEPEAVSEIHFTPGTPFFARAGFTVFF